MKSLQRLKLIGISTLLIAGLAACDKPGPAESAGKQIDQTADRVGEKMNEQGSKAGVAIADTEITTRVKAAIFAEPGLKTLQISVDTVNGAVTLSGSVTTQANSDLAKSLAAAVEGVKEVENKLAIKSNN